jgi:hypothetical protein
LVPWPWRCPSRYFLSGLRSVQEDSQGRLYMGGAWSIRDRKMRVLRETKLGAGVPDEGNERTRDWQALGGRYSQTGLILADDALGLAEFWLKNSSILQMDPLPLNLRDESHSQNRQIPCSTGFRQAHGVPDICFVICYGAKTLSRWAFSSNSLVL